MIPTKAALGAALLAAALIGAASITSADAREARDSSEHLAQSQQATLDIVDTAVAAGDFTTLAAALEAADLIDTLKGPGPFTVFAPTDAAFAALPAGTVEALLADVPGLTDVLLYHVVEGDVRAADVVTLDEATTVQGSTIAIAVVGGEVRLNDTVTVTTTDIVASNGVIHVIDGVLLPPASTEPAQDIVDTAVAAGDFTTLAAALEAADLIDTLKGPGPFTVFAPTDAAFAALPAGTVDALLADVPALTDVLLYHVVEGDVRAADVVALDEATAVQGSTIAIAVVGGQLRLNDTVTVTTTDIVASNGVIHVIDGVLLPPAPAAPGPPAAGNAGLADEGGPSSLAIPLAAAAIVGVLVIALAGRYAGARMRVR
jgi:uncharacterized surface protein with fasciclin (FAS1) repeats